MTSNIIFIIDGHNDTILDLHQPEAGRERSFFVQSDYGHIDLPRARLGGLSGGFFALFTPTNATPAETSLPHPETGEPLSLAAPIDQAYALQFITAMAARMFRLEAEAEGQIKIV